MEVHHHAHPVSDGTGPASGGTGSSRKKWTHYFWEFFMLFLAVTLGFFVENKREHIVEHGREKQYINSLLQDLKQDTSGLSRNIKSREKREVYAEYLLDQLSVSVHDSLLNKIHQRVFQLNSLQVFDYSNSTTQQLKSSGLMRLIRKTTVTDAVNSYDLNVSRHKVREEVERDLTIEYLKAVAVVFNPITLKDLADSSPFEKKSLVPIDSVMGRRLLTEDPDKINHVKGWIAQLHNRNLSNLGNARGLLKQATKVIELINKEYHLK
jgi:hypothetical protein